MTQHHAPNLKEQTLARDAQQLLTQAASTELRTEAGSLTLTPALTELLRDLLGRLGNGESVTILGQQEELSTQQAADLLGVSRPYLIGTVLDGRLLPYRMVGKHRRIRLKDLLAYQEKDLAHRRALAREFTELNQELDPY